MCLTLQLEGKMYQLPIWEINPDGDFHVSTGQVDLCCAREDGYDKKMINVEKYVKTSGTPLVDIYSHKETPDLCDGIVMSPSTRNLASMLRSHMDHYISDRSCLLRVECGSVGSGLEYNYCLIIIHILGREEERTYSLGDAFLPYPRDSSQTNYGIDAVTTYTIGVYWFNTNAADVTPNDMFVPVAFNNSLSNPGYDRLVCHNPFPVANPDIEFGCDFINPYNTPSKFTYVNHGANNLGNARAYAFDSRYVKYNIYVSPELYFVDPKDGNCLCLSVSTSHT